MIYVAGQEEFKRLFYQMIANNPQVPKQEVEELYDVVSWFAFCWAAKCYDNPSLVSQLHEGTFKEFVAAPTSEEGSRKKAKQAKMILGDPAVLQQVLELTKEFEPFYRKESEEIERRPYGGFSGPCC